MMGRWPWVVAGVLQLTGLVMLPGCSSGSGDSFFPRTISPTPAQAARDAFNVYDPDLRRRSVILLATADWGGDPAFMRAYRLLVDDPDSTVRCAALRALGRHGDAQDIPRGVAYLRDANPYVRWEAALMLQRLHGDQAIAPLTKAMRDDDDGDVRAACAYALAQYLQPSVFQSLVGALNDDDFAVVWQAEHSLRRLTGENFADDGSAWLAWAEKHDQHLFNHHLHYTWMEYIRKPTVLDRMKFWKTRKKAVPQEPRGVVIAAVEDSPTGPAPIPGTAAVSPAATGAPAPAPSPVSGDKPYNITPAAH